MRIELPNHVANSDVALGILVSKQTAQAEQN